MKNKIKSLSLLAAVTVLGISFNNAQAINQDRIDRIENKKTAIEDNRLEKICGKLENVITRLEEKIEKESALKLKEKLGNKAKEMEENRIKRDADLEERRADRNESRETFYNELEAKAGDDAAKKAAIDKFKTTVEAAIKTRREAIDTAKETLNKGVDSAIDSREASMETLRNEFKNDITAAFNKAKSSCSDNATSAELKTVMDQLKNDIKSARESYKGKVAEIKKVQSTIQVLRETRKASVKLAIENFKAAMKTAQAELRDAMGN